FGAGGAVSNAFYRYNPATNNYTTMASSPNIVAVHAMAYLGGKIYRVGGVGSGGAYLSSVDVYNIATNTWSPAGTIANYPTAVERSALVSDGTYLYGAGGYNGSFNIPQTYRYDPVANAWNDAAITDLP